MKNYVGTSKPKKHANKVAWEANIGLKIKQTTSI